MRYSSVEEDFCTITNLLYPELINGSIEMYTAVQLFYKVSKKVNYMPKSPLIFECICELLIILKIEYLAKL